MAVTKVPASSVLRMEFHTGVDGQGNPTFRTRSLPNVKNTAADQDIFDVATALSGLQEYPLNGISRLDSAELVQS